jgi:hypothetical protein
LEETPSITGNTIDHCVGCDRKFEKYSQATPYWESCDELNTSIIQLNSVRGIGREFLNYDEWKLN